MVISGPESSELTGKKTSQGGFTLVEIMAVLIIIAIIAAIALPKINSSVEKARQNADVATGHQVKTALDRYQVEKGIYPKLTELASSGGAVVDERKVFISEYISKLDPSVIQQNAGTGVQKGFAVETLPASGALPAATSMITIYLTSDGKGAEVKVVDKAAQRLWSSSED